MVMKRASIFTLGLFVVNLSTPLYAPFGYIAVAQGVIERKRRHARVIRQKQSLSLNRSKKTKRNENNQIDEMPKKRNNCNDKTCNTLCSLFSFLYFD